MAKRSISRTFQKNDDANAILDWLGQQLHSVTYPATTLQEHFLKQKIGITISLDPDKRGSMIPEGPKAYHRHRRE